MQSAGVKSRSIQAAVKPTTRASTTLSKNAVSAADQVVTMATFASFQGKIFPIVQHIVAQALDADDPFHMKWMKIQAGPNPINANSSFRNLSKVLNITDLQAYCQFLSSCPHIQDYVTLYIDPENKTGFYFNIKEMDNKEKPTLTDSHAHNTQGFITNTEPMIEAVNDKPMDTMTQTIDGDTITTLSGNPDANDASATPFEVCYGNDKNFSILLAALWPSIIKFIQENLAHDHTKQWQVWMDQGLSEKSSLAHFKSLLATDTFEQIFLFLRDSPAVNYHFELIWNHKIHYRVWPTVVSSDVLTAPDTVMELNTSNFVQLFFLPKCHQSK